MADLVRVGEEVYADDVMSNGVATARKFPVKSVCFCGRMMQSPSGATWYAKEANWTRADSSPVECEPWPCTMCIVTMDTLRGRGISRQRVAKLFGELPAEHKSEGTET